MPSPICIYKIKDHSLKKRIVAEKMADQRGPKGCCGRGAQHSPGCLWAGRGQGSGLGAWSSAGAGHTRGLVGPPRRVKAGRRPHVPPGSLPLGRKPGAPRKGRACGSQARGARPQAGRPSRERRWAQRGGGGRLVGRPSVCSLLPRTPARSPGSPRERGRPGGRVGQRTPGRAALPGARPAASRAGAEVRGGAPAPACRSPRASYPGCRTAAPGMEVRRALRDASENVCEAAWVCALVCLHAETHEPGQKPASPSPQ